MIPSSRSIAWWMLRRAAFQLLFLGGLVGTGGAMAMAAKPGEAAEAAFLDDAAQPANHLEWVRTKQGWQRPISWRPPPSLSPSLHPVVVAGLLALTSFTVLVAFPSPIRQDRAEQVEDC